MSTTTEAVRERPILFSGPMVRAILEGRKTMTRRVLRNPDDGVSTTMEDGAPLGCDDSGFWHRRPCPYGAVGGRLWVREAFSYAATSGYDAPDDGRWTPDGHAPCPVWYRATDEGQADGPWRPSIHMPRWASRLTLEITEVRVERLQEISQVDAACEGVEPEVYEYDTGGQDPSGRWLTDTVVDYTSPFAALWDSLNAERGFGWDTNPWCWVVGFRVLEVPHVR